MSHIQRKYSIKIPELEKGELAIQSIGRIEPMAKQENSTAKQLGKLGLNQ